MNLPQKPLSLERNLAEQILSKPDALQEHDYDPGMAETVLIETAEELVLAKQAWVVEEVRLSKQRFEHLEHVRDTIRSTDLQIQEFAAEPASSERLAASESSSQARDRPCNSYPSRGDH